MSRIAQPMKIEYLFTDFMTKSNKKKTDSHFIFSPFFIFFFDSAVK